MQNNVNNWKTHCMAKPNVPEIQNPKRSNVTATKIPEEASMRHPGDTATPKNCIIRKNVDSEKTTALD